MSEREKLLIELQTLDGIDPMKAKGILDWIEAKFGKDNNGMVPNPNQGYDNGSGHSGPCQPNCQCDIAKFSQQPPKEPVHDCGCGMGESCHALAKERKVSLEDIYIALCLECGNKERGDLLNNKEKENELWRYSQAILSLLKRHC